MPSKTLVGHSVAALLRQAQQLIGPDAVIVHVRRVRTSAGSVFEVTAADPITALAAPPRTRPNLAPGAELITPPQPTVGPLVVALIGPTGAGKTTTIGKLLHHPRVFGSRRVGIVSLDTYRPGAVEQLRAYARLAGAPCELCYDTDDLDRVRVALAGCDVWLVDTPGRGPRQRIDRAHLNSCLAALGPHEVHWVVPAATAAHAVRAQLTQAREPQVSHLLITKVDEAPDEAGPVEVASALELPVRWMTDGQEVPFDLSSGESAMAAARWSRPAAAVGAVE